MGFLKNKSVLFKLILALCIVLVIINFGINAQVVYATLAEENHYKTHEGEEAKPSGADSNEYDDGCKVKSSSSEGTISGTTHMTYKWTYYDGSTQTVKEDMESMNLGDEDNAEHSIAAQGGKLLQPVVDLLLTLGDGIMDVIQRAVVGTDGHIHIDIGISILGVIIGIIFAVIAIAAVIIAANSIGGWVVGLVKGIGWLAKGIATTKGIATVVVAVGALGTGLSMYSHTVTAFNASFLPDITVFPTYSVSPEEIFEGKLLIFDVNFFQPKQLYVKLEGETPNNGRGIKIEDYDEKTDTREVQYYFFLENGKEVPTSKQNTAMELSSVISKWYYTIRNIALVVMMLILVYVGIRMMLCSIASEKSKYKKMLGDWVISMCLVFVLHYIMVFAVNINESIIDLMEVSTDQNQQAFELDLQDMGARKDKFIDAIKDDPKLVECLYLPSGETATADNANQATLFMWPVNLVGRVRMMAQMQNGSSEYVGYAIAFLVLVFYTIFFAFTYLKRVLYLAFLTVIAPLVAMTYSIDKISDGKAQAFNMWLKEYIFNLLIQPVHLLLYMLLISMAIDLASQNIIYTLVAIGFMMPAEKLIRSMFGFEKAKTPGFLGGAAGAAVAMSAISKMSKLGRGSKGGNKPAGKLDKSNDDDPDGIYSRTADSGKGFNELFEGDSGEDTGNGEDAGSPNDNTLEGGPPSIDGSDNDSADSINFSDTEEPKNYFDNPDEYDEWLDLATTPDKDRTEDGEARQKELETKAEQTKQGRMLEESKRRQEEQRRTKGQDEQKLTKGQRLKGVAKKGLGAIDKALDNANSGLNKAMTEAIKPKNVIKSVAKTVGQGVKFTTAGVGAGLGAAAAIASGDAKSLPQNIALGATSGNALGGAITNAAGGIRDRYKQSKVEWEKDKYGDQYSDYKNRKSDEKFMKDREAREFYARECSSELEGFTGEARERELNKIMEQAKVYRQYGVTDNTLIVKARNIDRSNRTSSNSIAAAMMASKAKDMKGIKEYQEKLSEQIGKQRAANIAKDATKIAGFYK